MTWPDAVAAKEPSLLGLVPATAQRFTAHELVRLTLRKAILAGVLPGGTRLVQADIASQLEVSTTPVREALRDLATEGLIQLDAHRGAIVRSMDLDEVREIYGLRMVLEPLAVRRAIEKITEEEIQAAEELNMQMQATEDRALWVELNAKFHDVLTEPAGSPRLLSLITSLRDAAAMYVGLALNSAPDVQRQAEGEHQILLEAYRNRNVEIAVNSTLEHLQATLDVIESDNE